MINKILRYTYLTLVGGGLCLGISSCASDDFGGSGSGTEDENKTQYQLSINVVIPGDTSTRSATDGDGSSTTGADGSAGGTIAGTHTENILTSAAVYFCVDNIVRFSLESDYVEEVSSSGNVTNRIVKKLSDTDLSNLVSLAGEPEVQVFIAGNSYGVGQVFTPTGVSVSSDISEATFPVNSVTGNPIGDFGKDGKRLPLVNASEYTLDFSGITGADYNEILNSLLAAFFTDMTHGPNEVWWPVNKDLTEGNILINLERGVARLEYQDLLTRRSTPSSNPQREVNDDLPKNTFWVADMNLQVELVSLQPYNINKTSYMYRHGSEGDMEKATGISDIFKVENGGVSGAYNWISNPDWNLTGGTYSFTSDTRSFVNPLVISETAYSINSNDAKYKIDSSFEARTNGSSDGYHPMCYVSENTLYSTDLMEEMDGDGKPLAAKYATGVMFTFKVLDGHGNPIKSPNKGYNEANLPLEVTRMGDNIIITEPISGRWVELTPGDQDCYYMNYIANIVHNDMEMQEDGVKAPMYLGVVRNNTYQISIRKITGLPYPREPRTMYLQVRINVLKWDQRKNHFEF